MKTTTTTRTILTTGALAITVLGTSIGSTSAGAGGHHCQFRPATHVGTAGADEIIGTDGDDVIVAYGGNDRIFGRGGDDLICAGSGDDQVYAEAGDDRVYGEDGDDYILGYEGDVMLLGGDGEDVLWGNTDSDVIFGGPGFDHINGGTGGTGPGDDCSDTSGAVIGANFSECETYDTMLFVGTYADRPGFTIGK